MDLAGFGIAEAAAAKSAELEAAAAQSAELEAAATKPAADDFRPGSKSSTVASAGAAVAQGSFDTALAHFLVDKQKWDDLLSYLSGFMDLNDHPGLKFFILERQFLEHAHAKRGDAMGLVLGQVLALCAREEATDFIPADLSDRATKLSERALQMYKQSTSRGVEDDEESDLTTAICDYMRLYFPTTIRFDNKKWEGTLREFYHIYKDNTHVRRYRCLVCQWIVPASHDVVTIARNHIWHGGSQKHYGRLTANLVRRIKLSALSEVTEEDCMSRSDTSDSTSNKRKANASNMSHGESMYQVRKSVRKLPNNTKDIVASLLWEIITYCSRLQLMLRRHKIKNGMEMKRICDKYRSCATKLYFMYHNNRVRSIPLEYKVFQEEVESMMDINLKQLLPLLCCSLEGGAVREVVCQMDAVLCRIRELQMSGNHGLDH